MNKTAQRKSDQQITVDVEKLAGMLSCGRATARKIGEQAGARIHDRKTGSLLSGCSKKVSGNFAGIGGSALW